MDGVVRLDHKDRLSSALARGRAKSSGIERVRRDVDSAKVCGANAAQVSATRERAARRPARQRASSLRSQASRGPRA